MMRYPSHAIAAAILTASLAMGCAHTTGPADLIFLSQHLNSTRSVLPQAPHSQTAEPAILARVNGEPITEAQIQAAAGSPLLRAQMQLYDVREQTLEQLIEERLMDAEAKRLGLSSQEDLRKQVTDAITIDDSEIAAYFEAHTAEMQGKSLEEMKDTLRSRIYNERYQQRYTELIERLRKEAKVEVLMEVPRVSVDDGGSPDRGPKQAPVSIIEFGDFQCPYCGRTRPTIAQVLETYPNQVRYVFRDFPLPFHQQAMKAHEASYCAGDQGRYWEMNQKLFNNQQALDTEHLSAYAQELGLDTDQFRRCLDSGAYATQVNQNRYAGEQAGVSGTPTFFVNGRMVVGAVPFSYMQRIIEKELQRHQ